MNARFQIRQRLFGGLAWAVMLSLLLAACSSSTPLAVTQAATEPPGVPPTDAPTEPPTAAPPTETPVPPRTLSGLDADPQRVEFQAEDGKNLVGYYYPSKYANAPIVILMHWAGGDLTDWCAIAPWLQNRGDKKPLKPDRCAQAGAGLPSSIVTTWLDPTWFRPMNADASLAVFAFDFRDYGESEKGGGGPDWAKDAKAAFVAAAGLEGVDATRMAALGASIGADGAPDGCLLYNQEAGSGCVGALSLSPGNFLGIDFAATVTELAPNPVWCLTADGDVGSFPTCNGASGENYREVIYAGTELHGMRLIAPGLDPSVMGLIQEFLELVFGEVVK